MHHYETFLNKPSNLCGIFCLTWWGPQCVKSPHYGLNVLKPTLTLESPPQHTTGILPRKLSSEAVWFVNNLCFDLILMQCDFFIFFFHHSTGFAYEQHCNNKDLYENWIHIVHRGKRYTIVTMQRKEIQDWNKFKLGNDHKQTIKNKEQKQKGTCTTVLQVQLQINQQVKSVKPWLV